MDKKTKKYEDVIRPTVSLTKEEHKKIKLFCVKHDIKLQDFLRSSALYCLENKILPS